MDFLLYEAYCIYQAEFGTDTGVPIYVARANDGNIDFDVEETIDYASEALAKHADKKRAKDKDHGVKTAVIAIDRRTSKPFEITGLERERLYGVIAENGSDAPRSAGPVLPGSTIEVERRPKGGYDASEYG